MATDLREKRATAAEPRLTPAAEQRASALIAEQATKYPDLNYLIGQFAARQNDIALKEGKVNHGIFEKRLAVGTPNFTAVPHTMFFYYVRIDMDGRLTVDHYFYVNDDPANPGKSKPIDYDEKNLHKLVEKLAKNARPGAPKPRDPQPDGGKNFQGIKWTRKSYIAIFVDEANWKFHKSSSIDHNPAVVFITEPKNNKTGTENHSFFDAMDFDITMPIKFPKAGGPTEDQRSAILFVNHMKEDDQGTDLGKDKEEFFQFKMFLNVPFASGETAPMTVIFDPDGTNLGPPLGPP